MKKKLVLLAVGSIILCAVLGYFIHPIVSVLVFIVFWVDYALISFGKKLIINKWRHLKFPSEEGIREYVLYRIGHEKLVDEDVDKLSFFEKVSLYNFINDISGSNLDEINKTFVKNLKEKLKNILYSKKEYWDGLENEVFAELWSKLSKENYEHIKTFFFDDKEGFDVLQYFLWLKEKEIRDSLIWPTLSQDENEMLLIWLKRIYPHIYKKTEFSTILNHRGTAFTSHLLILVHNNSVKAMQMIECAIASSERFSKL